MDIDKFNSELTKLSTEIRQAMNSGLPISPLCNGWDIRYEKLLTQGIESNDAGLVLKKLVFLVRAGVIQDEITQKLASHLNTLVSVQNYSSQHIQVITESNHLLSVKVQKDKSDKQRGGKRSAESRKSSQYLDRIVTEYNELVSKNYPFHKRGRLTKFYKEMELKYPDIDGGAPSIKQRIEKVRKSQKNI